MLTDFDINNDYTDYRINNVYTDYHVINSQIYWEVNIFALFLLFDIILKVKFVFSQVDFVHNIFCKALTETFDAQKHDYGWGHKTLKIV